MVRSRSRGPLTDGTGDRDAGAGGSPLVAARATRELHRWIHEPLTAPEPRGVVGTSTDDQGANEEGSQWTPLDEFGETKRGLGDRSPSPLGILPGGLPVLRDDR